MENSGDNSSGKESIELDSVTPSATVSTCGGQQVQKAKRRSSDLTEAAGAAVALNSTGLTQPLNEITIDSSSSHGSSESDDHSTVAPPGTKRKLICADAQTNSLQQTDHKLDKKTDITPGEFSRTNVYHSSSKEPAAKQGAISEPMALHSNEHYIDLSLEAIKKTSKNNPVCLTNREKKEDYYRDESRELQLAYRKPDVYSGLRVNRPNLLYGYSVNQFDRPHEKKNIPVFSIKKFIEYLDKKKYLLKDMPNFVGTVRTFRLLMCAYHEPADESAWVVYAKRKNSIWFLSQVWSCKDGFAPDVKYAARMFELLMTNDRDLKAAAQEAKDFLKHAQSYEVWSATLGSYRLLYSGEIDCCDDSQNSTKTIELKTKKCSEERDFTDPKIDDNDILHYWAQAHLMRNQKVIIGCLDCSDKSKKTLFRVLEKTTEDIKPERWATWEKDICFSCLYKILDEFKHEFFTEAVTYEIRLDSKNKKIVARQSEYDLPC